MADGDGSVGSGGWTGHVDLPRSATKPHQRRLCPTVVIYWNGWQSGFAVAGSIYCYIFETLAQEKFAICELWQRFSPQVLAICEEFGRGRARVPGNLYRKAQKSRILCEPGRLARDLLRTMCPSCWTVPVLPDPPLHRIFQQEGLSISIPFQSGPIRLFRPGPDRSGPVRVPRGRCRPGAADFPPGLAKNS